ncbi:MAG: ABC transporter permease, partial [Gemmatimonadota bacterium]
MATRDAVMQDLRYALRQLRLSRGFSAVVVLTLALGIGATTAIFALVNAVVLAPLPYPEPERLVSIGHPVPGLNPDWRWDLSEAGYHYYLEHAASLEELAVYERARLTLASGETAAHALTSRVSASLFRLLGARPAHGRLLVPDDNAPGAPSVAVLGHDFWRTRFDSDPGVVGSAIELEGRPIEVVGVAGAGVDLPDETTDLWIPARLDPAARPVNWHRFTAIGRLAAGVDVEGAQADMERLTRRFPEALPEAYYEGFGERSGFSVDVVPLRDHVVGDVARVLWILLAAVGIVLLIACAN